MTLEDPKLYSSDPLEGVTNSDLHYSDKKNETHEKAAHDYIKSWLGIDPKENKLEGTKMAKEASTDIVF